MIIIIKKSNLLLIMFICIIAYMIFHIYSQDEVATIALPTSNKIIVIDAGHGYPDGGATSPSGIMEKDINLTIAQNLQVLIEQGGGVAVITRADDNSIHDPEKTTIREKKTSDLQNRIKMMDESQADIFVSIHLNKFEQSQYYGAQVFYSTNNEKSKILAQSIQKELIKNIDNGNKREEKPANGNVFILKNATVPAVIVECGFLSNSGEEKLLQTEKYQKKLAWSIYLGIMQYFSEL